MNTHTKHSLYSRFLSALIGFALLFSVFVPNAAAQTYYTYGSGMTSEETIIYLHSVINQLLAQLQMQQQYGGYQYQYNQYNLQNQYYQPYGQVLGASYSGTPYRVDVGTSFLSVDGDEITLNGTIDILNASYAYVWFEYDDEDGEFDEHTSRKYVTKDSYFSATIDTDDLRSGRWYYYRAVAESPSGHRDYGSIRTMYAGGIPKSSSRSNDDEPDASTDSARDIDENSAELRGEVDMNDFKNGVVFFVYGEDESQVEDIEDDYDEYTDIDEDGDDLQKVRVDSDLDGHDDYREVVSGLDDDTEYFFQICVEYEDEDDDEVIECGGVEDFETDRD